MKLCRICSEKLSDENKIRGTCHKCEDAINKIVAKKIIQGNDYPKKMKFKQQY